MPYKCLPTALKPILFSALFFMLFSFAPTTDETGSTLIGHWKLDEAAGTTLSDNSGLGNNAIIKTLNGIARVNGKYGLALDMPGTNNRFASTPNASALNITDKITITAWIRPVDVNSRTILSKTNPDGYEFGINNSGKIEFRFNATTNGNTYRVVSNSSYPVNGTTWMHVAVTFDGTASKIYVNGNLDVSVTYGGTIAIKTNTSPLYIGSLQTANRWRGAVDDIRIYRGALNASEIIQVMNNVSTAVPAAPVLLIPANTATNISVNPILNWNTVPSATSYRLEVSTLSNFSTTIFTQSNLVNTTQQVTGLLHETIYYWRIRGTNNGGDGAWSAVWSFTTALPAVPVAPILSVPANAATGISLDPTLGWNTVPGATSYRLEVSTLADFSTTVFAQSNLTNITQQVTGLLHEAIYYWRVRGTNNGGDGAWSAVWSFTTVPPAVPVAPLLSSPANASTGIALDPTLGWNTVSGATSYRLEVSTLADFSTTVFAQSSLANNSHQVTGLLNETIYYWRVRGTSNDGDGAWSAVWSFTTVPPAVPVAPILSVPANAATGISLDPTLGWNTVPGATSYRLEVSTLADFSTTVFAQSNLTNITQQVTGLLHEAIYYWRVRGTNNGGDGAWSAVWSFTTVPPAVPVAPILSVPANAATGISLDPTLGWNTVPGATSYRLEVSTLADFSTTVFAQSNLTNITQQVTGLLHEAIYYWRVRGTNNGGDGAWSAVWSFTTLPPAVPEAPVLSAPANAATDIASNPTLSWNTVTAATSYRLEVSTVSDFSTTVFAQDGLAATSQQVSGLLPATIYYWRVRGTNAGGDGAWSAVWSFTTLPPAVPVSPTLSSPANAATAIALDPTLIWNTVMDVISYRLEVSTLADFSTTVFAQSNLGNNSQQVSGLLNETLYYWRVRGTNNGGDGAWSAVWSFTTATLPINTLTLLHYWNFNNTDLLTPSLSLNGGSMSVSLAALSTTEAGTLNEFTGTNA
ncbi:MAG: LamG-like jellyroll fold domain-containing protein, partial [Bacteroidota bacterium]